MPFCVTKADGLFLE